MSEIAVFDFISHAFMHQPFNEGYLRTLRAGFPGDRIVFHARQDHVDQLAARFTAADRIEFRACPPLAIPFGLSRHNPFGGRLGAWRCWRAMRQAIAGADLRLAVLLGADANLLATFAGRWPAVSAAPLHLILHNHLAEAMRWRTRNPLFRAFDFRSVLQRGLAPNVRLVALELGIGDAAVAVAPALAGSIDTLEHPVLESEWAESPLRPDDAPLRVAFVGHASRDKGFDRFAAWARRHARPGLEFHAVGIGSPEALAMDLSGLARRPAARSESRPDYVAALAACDLVCLPLSPESYAYVASGSVIDAIAALKPLFSIRNSSLSAIAAKYGAIGVTADTADALEEAIGRLDRPGFAAQSPAWLANLRRLRAARTPEALAPAYAAAILAAQRRPKPGMAA